jgi:hypothetical protein
MVEEEMTVSIKIESNVKELNKKLGMFQKKHMPEIVADGINVVAAKSANAMRSQFAKSFDKPVSKTVKSVLVFAAKPKDLSALVFIRNKGGYGKPPSEYLEPFLSGKPKTPQKSNVIIPTKNTKTNQYGNITAGNRNKYFSNDNKYFVGVPKGFPNAGYGVWERYGRNATGSSAGAKIRMMVNLSKQQNFRKRFDFFKTVSGVVKNNMAKALDKEMRRILRR